jgi:hypothetical protein
MGVISGLDDLQRDLADAQRALESLDGHITKIQFDREDQASVKRAIRQMEAAVDNKVAPYGDNPLVSQIVAQAKEHWRAEIMRQAKKR